jgi:hypothetical protein
MMLDKHSHKKFWLAIVILAIVGLVFFINTDWVTDDLDKVQAQLTSIEAELAATQAELAARETELGSLEAELFTLLANYERLTTGYGYVLRDPSYREMGDFLAWDRTSEREYVESEYVCVDFAADVKANAAREGIRCAYVVIEYHRGDGHTIVAFDTTDEGLVFIEPQFDWEVEPELGKRYYQCVSPPPGHYMTKPGYDDTITRITVIW